MLVEQPVGAARPAGAAGVHDHVGVAPGYEEVAGARLDEPERRPGVLDLAGIRREGDERREASLGARSVHVAKQARAVAHRYRDVELCAHPVHRGERSR